MKIKKMSKIFSIILIILIMTATIGIGNNLTNYSSKTSDMELTNIDNLNNINNKNMQSFLERIKSYIEGFIENKNILQKHNNLNEPYEGYTLFAPMWDTKTYLIDNNGTVLNTWSSLYADSQGVYLLENGNLIRTALVSSDTLFSGGAQGRIEMFNTEGDKIWSYEYAAPQYNQHHDVEILPNGNILIVAWEVKTLEEAIEQGKNPNNFPSNEMWPDHIVEVESIGDSDINIVWEWHVWDHLIQDYDPSKNNYGVISEHPELIDINYADNRVDWNHINSIDYNEKFDQILVSVRMFDEIWIIDHSTTTEEAAGHSGGRYNKGGDILYRWGNPEAYNQGSESNQKYFGQHSGIWVEEGYPGEGNILVFNNGDGREYASVDEIIPPVDENGFYHYNTGSPYEPEEQVWIYTTPNPSDLNSRICSSAQRLPNGNTLICSAVKGYILEVSNNKEIVWEYYNKYPLLIPQNNVAEAIKYPTDYPGLPDTIEISQKSDYSFKLFING